MKINVAQIGVGYWGPNLLRNLNSNPKCRIKTVVEISNNRKKFVKTNYPDVTVTDNIDDVFNDPEIKAIIISTPVATHFDLAVKSLEKGKHILVEKPMAKTVEEVDEINKISKKKNLIAMVGHTFLYNSAVRYVKDIIDSGSLGDLRYIYSQRLNLGRIRNDVDSLWNFAPHDISIIQYWLNDAEPLKVEKSGMDYVQKEINDVTFMTLTYPNKIIAYIHVIWLDPQKIRKMTIVGSKKMIVYDDISNDKIMIYDKGIDRIAKLGEKMDFDDPSTFIFNHRSGKVMIPVIDWVEPLKTELNHFFECINDNIPCITGPEHARKVVKILSN